MAKTMAWFSLLLMSLFFVSNDVIGVYGELCKFGSGFFLLIQGILMLDFTHTWNEAWASKDHQLWYLAMPLVSLVCYIATFSFSGLLFHWFSPWGHGCTFNTFSIVITVILAIVFVIAALHPSVNGSLLPASVISLYCTYLCYSGLSREPRDYIQHCTGQNDEGKAYIYSGHGMVGMVTTVSPLVFSAVRDGSNSSKLMLESARDVIASEKTPLLKDEGRPVAYSYSLFHLIFAAVNMYSTMLLIGWTTHTASTSTTKLNDVGWPSVWVRICMEWITAALYIWTLYRLRRQIMLTAKDNTHGRLPGIYVESVTPKSLTTCQTIRNPGRASGSCRAYEDQTFLIPWNSKSFMRGVFFF